MDLVKKLQDTFGIIFPKGYMDFLKSSNSKEIQYQHFSRRIDEDICKIVQIDKVIYLEDFELYNKDLSYIKEFQEEDELPDSYVESRYLYQIINCDNTIVVMAFEGIHKGKIYTVDNGDFGIRYQADNLNDFLRKIFDLNEVSCTIGEIESSIRENKLNELKRQLSEENGNLLIENSSYHYKYLLDVAKEIENIEAINYLKTFV